MESSQTRNVLKYLCLNVSGSLDDDSAENDHENYKAPTANIVTLINTLMDYPTVHHCSILLSQLTEGEEKK